MQAHTHQDFTRQRLSPHFVYESFDEEKGVFYNRGSVGFILQGWPLVGASLQAQNEISEFLKEEENLPAGASFQVMMIGSKSIDSYLNYWASFRKGDIFQNLAKRRIDFLRKKAKEDGVIKDIFVLIAVTVPNIRADLQRCKEVLVSVLKSMGMCAKEVELSQLLKILRLFFGWDLRSQAEINPYEIIGEQILRGDFSCNVLPEMLVLKGEEEEQCIVALEAAKRPSSWNLALMDLFLGNHMRRGEQIKSDFILSFGLIVLPNQTLEKTSAMAKRESLGKSLKSGFLKWLPGLEEEYTDMDAAVVALQAGERMVVINQNVILKDISSKIKERQFEYRSMMRRSGFEFVPCQNDHLGVVLSCLPMQLVEDW